MYVALCEVTYLLVAYVACPDTRVREVETLLGSEAVDYGQRILLCSVLECLHRNHQATVVGDILAQCKLAVCVEAGENLNLVEEVHDDLCALVELGCILVGPPVCEVTLLVELTALVVEAVGHLVADDNSDGTIVERVVLIHVKERVLEDTCREADLVCCGVVVCVHGLWCHVPLLAVNRLAPLLIDMLVPTELRHSAAVLGIAKRGVYDKTAVVVPLVGVTDLYSECVQLLVSSLLCLLAHPLLCVDTLAKSHLEVLYKLCHALLCRRGEVLCNIKLADDVAQCTVNG